MLPEAMLARVHDLLVRFMLLSVLLSEMHADARYDHQKSVHDHGGWP